MKLLILDDHPVFRLGIQQLVLQRTPDATIEHAGSLGEALERADQFRPEVVTVDLNLPDAKGLEAVVALREHLPDTPLLVLSLNAESGYALRALEAGANGYVAKDHAPHELRHALDEVLAGRRYVSQLLAEQVRQRQLTGAVRVRRGDTVNPAALHDRLSPREWRIALLLAQDHRVQDIADQMQLSPKTVSTYRARVMEKLGLRSNLELTDYCRLHGLVLQPNAGLTTPAPARD